MPTEPALEARPALDLPRLNDDIDARFYGSQGTAPLLLGGRRPIGPELTPTREEPFEAVSGGAFPLLSFPDAAVDLLSSDTQRLLNRLRESQKRLFFKPFYHPYACLFLERLNRFGVAGLLDPDPSTGDEAGELLRQCKQAEFFEGNYIPNRDVVAPKKFDPYDAITFDHASAYSQYNWELFFHAPLLIADRLKQNQRFAEAQRWFHFIFDPTIGQESSDTSESRSSGSNPARFWKVRPFFEAANERFTPEELMLRLNSGDPELEDQVEQWRNDPFNPHLLARLRITAYMKTVVMKYLDNLIAWGDHLFRQDTLESTAEATQVYVLAANILGQRPPILPPRSPAPHETFETLEPKLDEFSNALVLIENHTSSNAVTTSIEAARSSDSAIPSILFFCIPANDKLLGYWDVVADRLFKLRHCMNIEGLVRELPLFEPPIDPALLVRARAMGVDLRDVVAGEPALSPYRFTVMLQKANELCAEVRSLGAALLSAYEKRDGEELARLRSAHEQRLLEAMKDIRQKQVEEALETKASLEKTKAVITERQLFYSTRQFMNAAESTSMLLGALSSYLGLIANGLSTGGASAASIPEFTVGVAGMAGSPTTLASTGGKQASNVAGSWSKAFELLSNYTNLLASLTGTMGNYSRRWEEWQLQKKLADKELEQIDKQITAADIRHTIALKEQENHELQRTHAQEVADHLRGKFSHQELYNWMVSELSSLYFQSYQLAYDTARRAERAYRHERGLATSSFIRFGQWDSLRRGLLAGEGLQLDLRRLEMAYLNEHRRDHELSRHVSLLSLNPLALILLKETGSCDFALPEWLFDLDHPGHYMRRIKSVSLSLPCVVGPYTNVNAKLTLVSNKVRISPDAGESYAETLRGTDSDPRFRQDFVSTQSIATSTGQNDSGLFELNFRDERYLPFEGAGVISTWRLELSGKWGSVQWPQFDFQTIADAILHLRYTARDGGDTLKKLAISSLNAAIQGPTEGEPSDLNRLFSLRHEFPTEWQRFKASTGTPASFQCRITPDRFPYFLQGKPFDVTRIEVYQPQQREPLACSPTLEAEGSQAWTLTVLCGISPLPSDLFVLLQIQL